MRLQPPATLLAGPAGSGKTSAIATMVAAGVETFVTVTEPDGAASLIDACDRLKADIDLLHWRECFPRSEGWNDIEDMVSKVSSMDQKQLSDMKDMGKAAFRDPALHFLRSFQNFRCDRTGLEYGDCSQWDASRCLAVDSLTGLSLIAWGATVGYKPTANPGEWGIAQNFVFNILRKVLSDRNSYFIMTSHLEKEIDEMTGTRRATVSTIGAKLGPKIPPFFSEFVLCSKRPDGTFNWSTLDTQVDLKNRALPVSATLRPDFAQIVSAYQRRLKVASQAVPTPPPGKAV
jgi:hypothetical protein